MKSNEIQKSPPSNWSRINKQACNSSFRYHYIRKIPILDLVTPIAIIISLKGECLMKQIASFTIDHLKLLPGVYVSRKDTVGNEIITTFDIRVTRPNFEPVMNTAEIHTIEHLAATYLRNDKDFGNKIIYFGPMGCRTGFISYLLEITSPKISFLFLLICLNLYVISKEKFLELLLLTAAIT